MKTSKIMAMMGLVLGIVMFSFTTAKAVTAPIPEIKKASCPYMIYNSLSCPVTVDITIYQQSPGCTAVCVVYTGVPIAANSSYQIICAGCNICNIAVTVTAIGTVPMAVSPADFSTTFYPGVPLSGGSCPSNGILYNPGAIPTGGAFRIF